MAIKFEALSEGLYTALFEPDPENRRAAVEAWVGSAIPVLQSAVADGLKAYLHQVLETRWIAEGWQRGVRKWRTLMDSYQLVMDIQLRPLGPKENVHTIGLASEETRSKTIQAAERALSQVEAAEAAKLAAEREEAAKAAEVVSSGAGGDDGGGYLGGGRSAGPSPNDQRANVMNPNNPAYQAAGDNRSNQMNPNNPAYWSSRGHGGHHR